MSETDKGKQEASQAIIDRIRKLMNYASDGSASEGEIENALGHARRLMDKFDLDEADIYKTDESRKAAYETIVDLEIYSRAGGIDHFDRQLAQAIGHLFDVGMYNSERSFDEQGRLLRSRTGKVQTRKTIHFYGLPRDCEVAKALYMELLATMRAMIRFRLGEGWQKEFNSYCMGFSDRIWSRCYQIKRETKVENNTTAIVLAKGTMVKRWAEANLSLTTGKRRSNAGSRVNDAIYGMGSEDGGRVSLGTNPGEDHKELR